MAECYVIFEKQRKKEKTIGAIDPLWTRGFCALRNDLRDHDFFYAILGKSASVLEH